MVTGRGKAKIDDFILHNFSKDYKFLIEMLEERLNDHHEELASIVPAIQGVMLFIGMRLLLDLMGITYYQRYNIGMRIGREVLM